MNEKILYSDKLVEITPDSILFRNYYLPFGSKTVPVNKVKQIICYKPTALTGKYRIYGTSDFQTWYPPDRHRRSRDRIFILVKTSGRRRIGFTVEDSGKVMSIFENMGILEEG